MTADSQSNNQTLKDEYDIYLLTLLPYRRPDLPSFFQPSIDMGKSLYLAAEIATEIINNNTNILKGYKVHLVQSDSGCNVPFRAVEAYISALYNQSYFNRIVGAIGPGCSISSRSVSTLAGRDEISLLNIHLGSARELDNRTIYKNSFGVLDSTEVLAEAMASVIEYNNWTNVSMFYDHSRFYFSSIVTQFNLKESNKNVNTHQVAISTNNLMEFELLSRRKIRPFESRIIFVIVTKETLNRILCIAHKNRFLYPAYQFIFILDSIEGYKPVVFNDYNCTAAELKEVIENSIQIGFQLETTEREKQTDSGISLQMFDQLYRERIADFNREQESKVNSIPIQRSPYSMPIFDSVWSVARALNASADYIDLRSYRYGQQNKTDRIREELLKLDFEGLSGRIAFDSETGRNQQKVVISFINGTADRSKAAYYDRDNGIVVLNNISRDEFSSNFIDDEFHLALISVPKPLVFVMICLTVLALLLLLVLNSLTLYYRGTMSVKASSIKINQVAFFSCYILILALIIAVLVYGFSDNIDSGEIICRVRHLLDFLISSGLTLLLGAICVRTWRLYRIFVHFNNPGRFIGNNVLLFAILVMMLLNFSLLTPAFVIDQYGVKYEDPTNVQIITPYRRRLVKCIQSHSELRFFCGFIVSFILLFITVSLSVLTRKIPQKNFKTKCVMNQSYLSIVCIPLLLGLYLTFTLQDTSLSNVLEFCTLCALLLFLILVSCVTLFFPPLLPVFLQSRTSQYLRKYLFKKRRSYYHESITLPAFTY